MGDYDALERRVADLNGKLDAVAQANTGAKLTARLVTVVIVISAIAGVYILLQPFKTAYEKPEPYINALQSEMQERVWPELESELKASVGKVGPEVAELVKEKAKVRYEDVVKVVDNELQGLVLGLKAFAETELAGSVGELEQGLKDRIVAAVPEIADDEVRETVIGNAAVGVENAVKRVVEETLERHITALNSIEIKLLQLPVPDSVKQMDDEELTLEMQRALSEYVLVMMQQTFSPQAKELLARIAEETPTTD